jgi:hypothetical protein
MLVGVLLTFFVVYLLRRLPSSSFTFFIIYLLHYLSSSLFIFFIIYLLHYLSSSLFIFFIIYLLHGLPSSYVLVNLTLCALVVFLNITYLFSLRMHTVCMQYSFVH